MIISARDQPGCSFVALLKWLPDHSSVLTLRSQREGLSCCAALSSTVTHSRHPQLSEKETEAEINSKRGQRSCTGTAAWRLQIFWPSTTSPTGSPHRGNFIYKCCSYWSLSHQGDSMSWHLQGHPANLPCSRTGSTSRLCWVEQDVGM